MYGSGIKALDDLAGELNSNSQSTFGQLNSEVSKHSSAFEEVCIVSIITRECFFSIIWLLAHVMQLFKGITSEADALLHDLQDSLHSQEKKLTAYAEQQREVCFFSNK